MNGRTRIGCGLLAGIAACLLAPGAASAADCPLPGSAGTGMSEVMNVQGDLAPSRTGGYLQIPFTVPAGTTGIQVRYSYDNQSDTCSGTQNNTLDMGVYEPKSNGSDPVWEQSDRRGWSGSAVKNLAIAENGFTDETTYNGNKKAFVDGRTTRAYQPGPIPAGEWAVELGIAYVDPADTDGIHYHVQVLTSTDAAWGNDPYSPSGPPAATVNSTPGWYTGDLHVHGEQEPGNATMTDTFAAAFGSGGAGLDFVTLVDHNNNTAHDDMKAQADVYPDNLVIPGVEVTTYEGHWNNQGSSSFADFRGGPVYTESSSDSQIDDSELVQSQAAALPKDQFAAAQTGGGWTQINHPATYKDDPSGCRGCAWTYSDADTDFSKVDAIEVSNSLGALSKGPFTLDAIAYYEHALDTGAHIAAIGSSDAHQAASNLISHVGEGVTVVHADGLGKQAIIDGVKADRTYVKPFGPTGPDVTLEATDEDGGKAIIGDSISGRDVTLDATVSGIDSVPPARTGTWELELLRDGVAVDSTPITGAGITQEYALSQSGRYSIEVTRTSDGTYIEDYTSPIWVTVEPKPSNKFSLGKPKVDKKKGTAKLPVKVPGAGKLKLSGKSVADAKAKPSKASTVKLPVKPVGKLKKKLRKKGKAKAEVTVTFTPKGGNARKVKKTVKLVKKG